jgi:hypothetical protein
MEAYLHGTSTRKVDDLVKALGADSGISKSEVSRICADLDTEIAAQDVAGHAELILFTITHTEDRTQDRPVFPAPSGHQPTPVRRDRRDSGKTITGSSDWSRYHITAQVPADADTMGLELTLTGHGTVRLRRLELTRAS